MAFDYDLFVIGGGSGGVRAARLTAQAGFKVGLAEESRMGGTCVIRGCVPKKLMVFASSYPDKVREAQAYGWDAQIGAFDWTAFRTKMHAELDRLEGVYRNLLSSNGVTIHDGRASLVDAHTVEVNGARHTAKHILVATGGRPVRPDLPNAHLGMVSDDIFLLENLPETVLIIGGGYIACEFACLLNGLGVKVTQYYRGAQILRGFDEEARGLVAERMKARGVDLHVGTNIVEMWPANEDHADMPVGDGGVPRDSDQQGGPVRVKSTNGSEQTFDAVFFATGRTPNTGGIGLDDTGVKLGRRGEVVVDDYSQTDVPSVYAIGDVTGRIELTPVAIREGVAFHETVFQGNPTKVDHELVPSAVFTQPELASVGLTEEAARDLGPIEVYCTSFKPMRGAFAGSEERVLFKLVVCQEKRTVLGCHFVCDEAGELIQLAGIAVKMGATKEDFDRTVAVHPTMAEEIVTMKEPVRRA